MFVSQVTFEGSQENDEKLKQIMKKKLEDAQNVPGLQSVECWQENKENMLSYTLVIKWRSKDDFKAWIIKTHSGQSHHRHASGDRMDHPEIKKYGHQYEVVEL